MAPIPNPSFESPLSLGPILDPPERFAIDGAADWTTVVSGHEWEAASFKAELLHVESFEMLWSFDGSRYNDEAIEVFAIGDLVSAAFGFAPFAVTVYENFETQWSGNQFTIDEFDGSTLTKAAGSPDGFSSGWYQRHLLNGIAFVTTVTGTTLTDLMTRLNLLKSAFNSHRVIAGMHTADDTINVVSSFDATDLGSSETLAAELWTKVWLHVLDAGLAWHREDFIFAIDDAPWEDVDPTPSGLTPTIAVANALTAVLAFHQEWAAVDGVAKLVAMYAPDDPPHVSFLAEARAAVFGKETFETGWDNTPRIDAFTSELSAAGFTTDGADDAYEGFERALTVDFPATDGVGVGEYFDPTGRVRLTVTIAVSPPWNATASIQSLDSGSTTWVTRETIDAGASGAYSYDPDEGFQALRLVITNYVAGSGTAALKWQPLPAGSP